MGPGCRRHGRGSGDEPAGAGSAAGDAGPAIQIVGESARLRLGDPTPAASPWFDGARVSVIAARGETVGLQVVHRGGGPVRLRVASAGVTVRGFAVEAVAVRRPSTAMYGGSHGAGRYPEALTPADAPASDPAYFELVIARDAAPGAVTGELTVAGRALPVALTIAPVTLPPLAQRVWAYENEREPIWDRSDERACIAMFRDHGVLLSPDLHLEDWLARRELVRDVHDVPVWISDDPAQAAGQVRAWIEAFRGTSQVPFAIPIDEPRTPEARRRVRALADVVRAAGGGPTTFRFAVTDAPDPIYGDAVDLFISPLAARLPHAGAEPAGRRARWTYNGAPPRAGSMVLDAEPPGMRTWGWIAWRWEIPIWYVWDALYWHDRHNRKATALPVRALDVGRDAVSFDDGEDHGNLDGVLALPGCQRTLRLASLRRGFEDLALLDEAARCDRAAAERVAAAMVPRALGDAADHGAPAWPSDEAPWEAARQQLIAIARCGR
jgi:hypothetical protein